MSGAAGRKRKAAAAAPAPALPQVFEGCRLFFLQRGHLGIMMKRVVQHGGALDDCIGQQTTHAVVPRDVSTKQLTEKLSRCPPGRECREVVARDRSVLQVPVGLSIVTADFVCESILRRARQPEASYLPAVLQPPPPGLRRAEPAARPSDGAAPTVPLGSAVEQALGSGATVPLPSCVVEMAGDSHTVPLPREVVQAELAAARAAPLWDWPSDATGPLRIGGQQLLGAGAEEAGGAGGQDPDEVTSSLRPAPAERGGPWAEPAAAAAAGAPAAAAGEAVVRGGAAAGEAVVGGAAAVAAAAAAGGAAAAAAGRGEAPGGGGRGDWGGVCEVRRCGHEFECVRGSKPRFTGGHTGIPWGSFGVWAEPYDEAAARDTVSKVRDAWYHVSRHPQLGEDPRAPPRNRNNTCSHVACSRSPFCIVERLSKHRALYSERGVDQFKAKQLDFALRQLRKCQVVLQHPDDVDRTELKEKAREKVKEILTTGTTQRLALAKNDPRLQVLRMFTEVWGCGEEVASQWYGLGCRTLEDVCRRAAQDGEPGGINLTPQQEVGIKYYHEITQRIPREEIAEVEKIARCAIFELVEALGGRRDVERTFAGATGSYARGRPDSGDIDILACLPPSLQGYDCGEFLHKLLASLLRRGLLTEDMEPLQRQSKSQEKASWMGICRPHNPHRTHRRIDIKVYAHKLAPFALNYFCNSRDFCRGTRFWSNTKVAERARQYHSKSTGFKLSDERMVPRWKQGWGPSKTEILLSPELDITCETDIFEALGLAYVPPHMRFF